MSKTKRDALFALADKIGGSWGDRLRESLTRKAPFDAVLDAPLSDRDFVVQLATLERELKAARAKSKPPDWEPPESWGLSN